MNVDPIKRQLREHKRKVKRAGSKHRRRELKKVLDTNPAEAIDAVDTLGKHRSDRFNGMDRDATRNRDA